MGKKRCTGTGYDIDHCREEKMGCEGCAHYRSNQRKENCYGKKIGECPKDKSDKTN